MVSALSLSIRKLKALGPASLFTRFLLITIVPTIILQIVATYIFYNRHWESVQRNMSASLGGEIAILAYGMIDATPEAREDVLKVGERYMILDATFAEGLKMEERPAVKKPYHDLAYVLARQFDFPFAITHTPTTDHFTVAVELPDGLLTVNVPIKRIASSTTQIFILWMTGTATLLVVIAVIFLRNQIRSITRLADVAERFGKGQEIGPYRPTGAREVRQVGQAFMKMKDRIKRLLNQRTQMLAGVSHDIRTPLTRMKLELELLKDTADIEPLKQDLEEMEEMVEGYLDFARGGVVEATLETKLTVFLNDVVERYRHKRDHLKLEIGSEASIELQYNDFKRCVTNLIDNGLRYGKNVWIATKERRGHVLILIDDDGPGIPETRRGDVFQPFFRMDHSRNAETGGVGLGMSISQDIVHRHGGEIFLEDSPKGGLRVVIDLPL